MIPLARPDIGEEEIEAVLSVLRSGRLSLGPELEGFERAMMDRLGSRHAVGVSSGTAGLHLLMRAYGIGEGDEVITTPFSFIASANAIAYERARPVFVDIEADSLNIDPAAIEAAITPRTRALLLVHVFGRAAAMDVLLDIAERHDLLVIEDACEALGGLWHERPLGSLGHAGVFGFYPNKQITTGEGGIVVTDDVDIAATVRSLANQGRDDAGNFPDLGYNYRLSEMQAALGRIQLRRLDVIMDRRQQVATMYNERLRDIDALTLLDPRPDGNALSWFVYVVRVRDLDTREWVCNELARQGIQTGRYFPAIHLQRWYVDQFGYQRGDFPTTEAAADTTVALPFYSGMLESEVDRVCEALKDALTA